jgi:hypothetical protein
MAWISPWRFAGALLGMFLASSCYGDSVSLTGSLDPNDANDVLLFAFMLGGPSELTIQTYGYGGSGNAPGSTNAAGTVIPGGGFDPYVSLFVGSGPGATFLASNDDGSCPPGTGVSFFCPDSTLIQNSLPAGTYTLALSVFDNFSFAENLGTGTLGDGFIGLGDYFDQITGTLRTANYAVDILAGTTLTPVATPEPSGVALLGAVSIGALLLRRHRRLI